ncbi:hypothetical protein [Coleofasciculus sp. FACHB-129]|uniref:hypothetical protein n=1 Tax=Cyanophyceae TaxID=3028117 RepID=UPI00168364ED|nr:hypothetical protein [Coleofasciculus sp. FACHB-129]MBD1893975.1 hypothetical protein [Coleofasciculus sp. FACHB-129]
MRRAECKYDFLCLSPQSSALSPQSSALSPQSSVLSPQSSVFTPYSSYQGLPIIVKAAQ